MLVAAGEKGVILNSLIIVKNAASHYLIMIHSILQKTFAFYLVLMFICFQTIIVIKHF